MQRPRIRLVEDERSITDTLVYPLQREDFQIIVFGRRLPALEAAAHQASDVVILNAGLPGISDLELCRHMLTRYPALLMLFLAVQSGEIDKLPGLETGVNDYIVKLFSSREVYARVRTVLRRLQKFTASSPVVRVGEFVLDEQAVSISWFGQPLNLTRYEFLLLKTLLHASGRVFSRQQLMRPVWNNTWESLDRAIDTHIRTLCAKLRAVGPEVTPINIHRGMGYGLGRGWYASAYACCWIIFLPSLSPHGLCCRSLSRE